MNWMSLVGYTLVGLIVVTYLFGCVFFVVMMYRLGKTLRL